jgi:hypothetical protein
VLCQKRKWLWKTERDDENNDCAIYIYIYIYSYDPYHGLSGYTKTLMNSHTCLENSYLPCWAPQLFNFFPFCWKVDVECGLIIIIIIIKNTKKMVKHYITTPHTLVHKFLSFFFIICSV